MREPLTRQNTTCLTSFERDNAHVHIVDAETEQRTIIEWRDAGVSEAVTDGFLDPSDWHGSALAYLEHLGFIPEVL